MTEQSEGQQTVADEAEAGVDPVAAALALDGASRGAADKAELVRVSGHG